MARLITRDELRAMLERGDDFCLVEVSRPASYDEYHLPRAMNVPFDEHFQSDILSACPDRHQVIVLYDDDPDAALAGSAADCMDRLGYHKLLRYAQGKLDWRAHRLHCEGRSDQADPTRTHGDSSVHP